MTKFVRSVLVTVALFGLFAGWYRFGIAGTLLYIAGFMIGWMSLGELARYIRERNDEGEYDDRFD